MAIEAPASKFRKTNLKIYIAVCIALAIWCAYDGYFNQQWIQRHTSHDARQHPYLIFNRNAPPYFIGAVVLLSVYFFVFRKKKIIADEKELIISGRKRIPYDSIQKIDKTHFDSKGFFLITYKDQDGREISYKLSNRAYDNLPAILDQLIAKIS